MAALPAEPEFAFSVDAGISGAVKPLTEPRPEITLGTVRASKKGRIASKLLIGSVFCLGVALCVQAGDRLSVDSESIGSELTPLSDTPPEAAQADRVQILDDAQDAALRGAIAVEWKRLASELHERQGWRFPFREGDPVRISIARRDSVGQRRLSSPTAPDGRLASPSIDVDAAGLSNGEIVRRVSYLYTLATLSAYGISDSTFLTIAVAGHLSHAGESEEAREDLRVIAAAPSLDLAEHPTTLGRLYVEEFVRASSAPSALRHIWEKSSETGEQPLYILLRSFAETTGERPEALLLRAAARLYASVETEPAPSRVSPLDLETGALDAITPASFALRHRTLLPAGDSGGALRVAWPTAGAPAAAVVRYRDPALPPDVVFFSRGEMRTIPLSGISRVDWIVTGMLGGPPLNGSSALFETLAAFPFEGLNAKASAVEGDPQVSWTTAAHEALAGWAVFREEVLPDGRIARTGPQILPASGQSQESFAYAYVDSQASRGTFYRYTVWAVTGDGLLARAFAATLRTPD